MEAGIGNGDVNLDIELEVIREVSLLREGQELMVRDGGNLSIGEGRGKAREGREVEQDSKAGGEDEVGEG